MELYIEKLFFLINSKWFAFNFKWKAKQIGCNIKTYGDVNLLIDYALNTPAELNQFNIDFFEK
jgi:hypothetical protein